MAQKIIRVLEDDLSGGPADETVSFALAGASYEIDLSAENADGLRAALAPYIAAGRRTQSTGRRRSSGDGPSAAEIRAWAQANGHNVPSRGRIPASVRQAFSAR